MNITAKEIQPFYKQLYDKLVKEDFLVDKSGCKIVEIIAPRIELTINKDIDGFVDFEAKKSPRKYIEQEKEWYDSHELKIDKVGNVKIWNDCANVDKEINSNYGNLVFSRNNYSQFTHVVETLKKHKDSRQGIIIYTRPSIQLEWNDLGGTDFICTNFQHFFIRNNKLQCVVSMRSNDSIFGTMNDLPWFFAVYKRMMEALKGTYPELKYGKIVFIPNSFHCYERHFDLLKRIANEVEENPNQLKLPFIEEMEIK